jgi:SAM-dependent methyltransferase
MDFGLRIKENDRGRRRHMLKEYLKVRGDEFDDIEYNLRFIKLYKKLIGGQFSGLIADIGCGGGGFVRACRSIVDHYVYEKIPTSVQPLSEGESMYWRKLKATPIYINATGVDHEIDFETDRLPFDSKSCNVVHMNAVIEHLDDPEVVLIESRRILDRDGILIINTPNWKLDHKNFYNDPTHKHPYTPESISMLVKMFRFEILFCEPALIRRSPLWWKLPFKWRVASLLPKGSKSILLIARKI